MNKFIIYIIIVLTLSSCGTSVKLICHYNFNGNLNDKSKNEWHLNDSKIGFTNDRNNKPNSAILIDKDALQLKGDSSHYTLPISFSFWINFSELNPTVLGMGVSENKQTGIWFSIGKAEKTLNKIAISIGNGGRTNPASRKTFVCNNPLKKNQWYHVVATIDKKTNMQIYIDGELQEGFYTGYSTTFKFGPSTHYLGKVWKTDDMFKGAIDDFRIYSTALNKSQVKKIKRSKD